MLKHHLCDATFLLQHSGGHNTNWHFTVSRKILINARYSINDKPCSHVTPFTLADGNGIGIGMMHRNMCFLRSFFIIHCFWHVFTMIRSECAWRKKFGFFSRCVSGWVLKHHCMVLIKMVDAKLQDTPSYDYMGSKRQVSIESGTQMSEGTEKITGRKKGYRNNVLIQLFAPNEGPQMMQTTRLPFSSSYRCDSWHFGF